MSLTIYDGTQKNVIVVGSRVMYGDPEEGKEHEQAAVVTQIDEPDVDHDDETGGPAEYPAQVHIVFDNGEKEKVSTYRSGGRNHYDDDNDEFTCDDLELLSPPVLTLTQKEAWNLYRLERPGKTETLVLPLGVASYGDYNSMPAPWREIDYAEFKRQNIWTTNYVDQRQITHRGTPELVEDDRLGIFFSVKIEWSWWGALAIHWPEVFSEKPIRYFLIGCAHDFKQYALEGQHYHKTRCWKCGMLWSYDSSG